MPRRPALIHVSDGVTLESVAALAKVSVSTVSRALTRPERVAKVTRERVLKAALELGYAPNQLARSLRQRASKTIGLIISDILVPFHSEVAKGVEDVAQAHGYSTILCNSGEDGDKERQYLELLKGFRVGGIILEPTEENLQAVEGLARGGTPVVEVDRFSGAQGVSAVLSDNEGGAAMAARHLLEKGHRACGIIAGNDKLTSGRERLAGFKAALEQAGCTLRPEWVRTCPNTPEAGYQMTLEVLRTPHLPTALFVTNAQMMHGSLRAFRELGLRLPQDLSVISFDETHWAPFVDPPLTVVAQQAYDLGRVAANIVLEAIEHKSHTQPNRVIRLETRLITRASCAAWTRKPAQRVMAG